MKRLLILLPIAALISLASFAAVPPHESVYRLDHPTFGGYCSAFVIDQARHYLMTADHCVQAYDSPLILGVKGREIFHVPDLDVAVIEFPGLRTGPALAPAYDTPAYKDKVLALGFAKGKDLKILESTVMIRGMRHEAAEGWFVIFGPPQVINGMSGGAWVDSDNRVIAVIQMSSDKEYDYSVSRRIEDIYPATKDYWEKKAPEKMRDDPAEP